MSDTTTSDTDGASPLAAISTALVQLHKEQFGRGPTQGRTNFAGPDTVICVLENALLPAEKAMVELGEAQRVHEQRLFMQTATSKLFIDVVEKHLEREVRAFSSAVDPGVGVVFEVFALHPAEG